MTRNQLAEVLRVERARRKLTLREASTASGLSISVVSELERGTRNARYDSIRNLLAAYGLDLAVNQLHGEARP